MWVMHSNKKFGLPCKFQKEIKKPGMASNFVFGDETLYYMTVK